jgi:peroxiredoxin
MNELGEFVKRYEEFKALDVQIIGISVDSRQEARYVQNRLNAPFPILSDANSEAMDLYGTRSPQYNNREGKSLNVPTLVLIDKTGKVRWIHQAATFRVRENVEEDLAEARKLK